jgi:lipoprotein-anchoring transpeptidase ErfK/SrfK
VAPPARPVVAASTASAVPPPSTPPVDFTIAPADGDTAVAPATPVSVLVSNGILTAVSVRALDGSAVPGVLNSATHSWAATAGLVPATTYAITATALDNDGVRTERSATFTTAPASKVLGVKIAPLQDEVVGVGMPIILYFSTPVTDKAAVERALTVDSSLPVTGAWHWYSNTEVHYRPVEYWPAHDQITVQANLKGVDAGKGVWGMENRTLSFSIGDAQVSEVDAKTHIMTVTVNGDVVRTMPVSTGRDKYPTTSGVHVVLEKTPSVIMDSATVGIPKGNPDYYYETVAWDVRISWSGEFVHAAPWSTGAQGHENVSHGCVNASPADAKWFYDMSRRGDIVMVTGTPRPLVSGNGWTDWNLDWQHWLAGSALQS